MRPASESVWLWRDGSLTAMMGRSASQRRTGWRSTGGHRLTGARLRCRGDGAERGGTGEDRRRMTTRVLIVEDDIDIRGILAGASKRRGSPSAWPAGSRTRSVPPATTRRKRWCSTSPCPMGLRPRCLPFSARGWLSRRDPVLELPATRCATAAEGLALGADDYIVKPFVFDELLAAFRPTCCAAARRTRRAPSSPPPADPRRHHPSSQLR